MKVAVLQSNYIPWKGYFDIIHDAELFVFFDDLQYTKNDWRNRNKIKTSNGTLWLTLPVGTDQHRLVEEVLLPKDPAVLKRHFAQIKSQYSRAPFYKKYLPFLEHVYLEKKWEKLIDLDRYLIMEISREFLGIKTRFTDSHSFTSTGVKHERLLTMLQSAGATTYISGPAAKDYIITEDYEKAGIELVWKDYSGYPVYKQQFEPFDHAVSILDLLLNTGDDAPWYIWGWREEQRG